MEESRDPTPEEQAVLDQAHEAESLGLAQAVEKYLRERVVTLNFLLRQKEVECEQLRLQIAKLESETDDKATAPPKSRRP